MNAAIIHSKTLPQLYSLIEILQENLRSQYEIRERSKYECEKYCARDVTLMVRYCHYIFDSMLVLKFDDHRFYLALGHCFALK